MRKTVTLGAVFLLLSLPIAAPATTLVVGPVGAGTHTTIRAALTAAAQDAAVDRIFVMRGTYPETLTLVADVTLQGEDAAETRINGAVTFAAGATLERVTVNGTVTLTGLSSALIRNNIFSDVRGPALSVNPGGASDTGVRVVNNTFYSNDKGLELVSHSSAQIAHNLFVKNTTAISRPDATSGAIENNWFFQNTQNLTSGSLDSTNTLGDPGFVGENASQRDLHITRGSAACRLGAFGDLNVDASPDPTPAPPTGLTSVLSATELKLSWNGNAACDSAVSAYRVKFLASGQEEYTQLAELPANGTGTQRFKTDPNSDLFGAMPAAPATPVGVQASPLDRSLRVSWTAVGGADGYTVSWGLAEDALDHSEEAGNSTSHIIKGLANGTRYFAAVASFASRKRFFAVTALPKTPPAAPATGESPPSEPLDVAVGRISSSPSPVVSAIPDTISGFPDLEERGGCFLHTLTGPASGPGGATWAGALLLGLLAGWSLCRRLPRRGIAAGVVFLLALAVRPPEADAAFPRWAVSAGGGVFLPRQADWSDHYDEGHLWEGKLGVGFRLFRQVEIGLDGGFRRARGEVAQTDSGSPIEPPTRQTLSVVPLQSYLLLQLCFTDDQWVVPYVAGGYSRYYYQLKVDQGDKVSGHQDGYHARGGLKVLLDGLDPYFAERAFQHWGIWNTYLALEAQYAKVDDRGASDTNLGGVSYSAEIVIEF